MSFPDVYETQLVARRASSVFEDKINDGGRVLLPPAVLQQISSLSMVYPLQFRIQAFKQPPVWAGVLEFNAEHGTIVLPDWMYDQLKLQDNARVRLQTCSLGSGKLLILRPHNFAFVQITDPRLVLERSLVNYPVLTKGSTIVVKYVGREFKIDVVDILGANKQSLDAVLTARADSAATELNVEFERALDAPPSPTNESLPASSPTGTNVIGGSAGAGVQFTPFAFKPPTLTGSKDTAAAPPAEEKSEPAFVPFAGNGRTLTGAPAPPPQAVKVPTEEELRDLRAKRLQAFSGKGHSLRS